MKSWTLAAATVLNLWLVQTVTAQQGNSAEASDPAISRVTARVDAYVDAFNRRDANGCAEQWSSVGEYMVEGGDPIVSRFAISAALQAMLSTDERFRLSVHDQRFRKVSENVITEEGVATLVSEKHGVESARYFVVHVRKGGTWYRDSAREVSIQARPSSPLDAESLTPLLGQWEHVSDGTRVKIDANWILNKHFVSRSFDVVLKDQPAVSATELIGLDPTTGTLRSWSFDSRGGFEQATWHRDGNEWLIKADAVLPEGITATEQRSLSIDADGNLVTRVIEQQVGGLLMPGSESIVLVRPTPDPTSNQ